MSLRLIDLTAKQFGRLTVLRRGTSPANDPRAYWVCHCDCGKIKTVSGGHLRSGASTSCGCYAKEQTSLRSKTHGMRNSPEYGAWCGLRGRCHNKQHFAYHRYGGRGITVCKRWLGRNGFANFYKDMGPKPSRKYTIERIDNDGDYEPENCRWATLTEQQRNRSNNRRLTYKGKTKTITEWAEELGFKISTIQSRLNLYGWSVKKALSTSIIPPSISGSRSNGGKGKNWKK